MAEALRVMGCFIERQQMLTAYSSKETEAAFHDESGRGAGAKAVTDLRDTINFVEEMLVAVVERTRIENERTDSAVVSLEADLHDVRASAKTAIDQLRASKVSLCLSHQFPFPFDIYVEIMSKPSLTYAEHTAKYLIFFCHVCSYGTTVEAMYRYQQ